MEVVAEDYQDDDRISFFQNLDDIGIPHNCNDWSELCGTESFDIVDDGNHGIPDYFLQDLFALDAYWHNIAVIDHNMVFRNFISCYSFEYNHEIVSELRNTIEEILLEMETLQGDVNQDGIINVQDIILTINLILDNEYHASADMNNDNEIDVLDIVSIVSLIIY